LTTAGNSVPDQIIPTLVHLISSTSVLHVYTVSELFKAIRKDIINQPLNQVAAWCIGEYAEVLLAGSDHLEPLQPIGKTNIFCVI
jgi:AP-1 complex subunit gamma-1